MAFEWHFATEKKTNGDTTLYKLEYFFFFSIQIQCKFNKNDWWKRLDYLNGAILKTFHRVISSYRKIKKILSWLE